MSKLMGVLRRRSLIPRPIAVALALSLVLIACGDEANPAADRGLRIASIPDSPLIGLGDNRPETFDDPRFKASGIKHVRVTVPYDDVVRPSRRPALDLYFKNARAARVEPLVSFYRSYRSRSLLPTVDEYRRYFRAFRKAYPWVHRFSTWNEANFPAAQPTGRDPVRTAAFYRVARQECAGGRCSVLTNDFRADGSAHSAWWLRQFKRHMGPGPHTWGLVSHPDVNRITATRTLDFLSQTRGPVWISETGALNFFGKGVPPDLARQARVMRYLMGAYARVSPRIKRMYVYHWRAAPGNTLFDSALLSVDGTRRPAYFEFFKAVGRKAP